MKNTKVCFIGHRKVENKEKVFEEVKRVVKDLTKQEGVLEFLFGSNSEFDSICYEVVTSFMSSVPSIRRIRYTCLSESCVLENERVSLEKKFSSVLGEEIHLRGFEEEVHHKTRLVAGRAKFALVGDNVINAFDSFFGIPSVLDSAECMVNLCSRFIDDNNDVLTGNLYGYVVYIDTFKLAGCSNACFLIEHS